MRAKEKAVKIIDILARQYPDARIHLDYKTPLQLLVATILAAQCTDERVNQVTPALWKSFPTADDIASAEPEAIQRIIHPTGFFNQKTRSIQAVCRTIADEYNGEVPDDMERLTSLPGVGRKTANVVLAAAFGRQTIPVDTHVKRVSTRLGIASGTNPDQIEAQLCKLIPENMRTQASLVMGEHGRRICKSRRPNCPECVVRDLCDYAQKQAIHDTEQ